ncbi:peptide chain release factor N(5)-glutamine methyltransferase [Shimia thalassica]|uniref:peptide chain release factor N(5)-glutamine methyltransferase n=1 Tax=Shimia thalassica TaxID=1715693 RepID=UPI002732F239|nr:peptide chain release factor N(5)-glutamine methyltransferase [Shimia thalassica]MDP2495153.1 peptide chain release factor N(5)-glutamine methyltransferase [Shimia thalassica]
MILRDALRKGIGQLRDANIEGPERDVRILLAHVMGIPTGHISLEPDMPVRDAQFQAFENALIRRTQNMPVSKIIGKRQFWGRDFLVTSDVLDPRPETETLIAEVLAGPSPRRILDLGTGSGILPVTLLAERPAAVAVATDISPAALAVAWQNAETYGVSDRLTLQQADWFKGVEGQFDLILSNPPYISEIEMLDLSPEVLQHDPHLALTPGGDGLSPYVKIGEDAHHHLAPQGRLLVEIGWKQGPDVLAIFREAGLSHVQIHTDLDGRDRVVSATIA